MRPWCRSTTRRTVARPIPVPRNSWSLALDRGQVDRLAGQLGAADVREQQQVVDQLAHSVGGGQHPDQIVPGVTGQGVAVLVLQDLAEADQGLQRRAQVVGDRIAERLQLLVLALQLLLPDPPVLVLELLAPQLRPDPGPQDLEVA
jgi:hypothetical protein